MSRYLRHRRWTWRYLYNGLPSLAYRLRPHRADIGAEGRRVVASLRQDGLAVTSVSSLLGSAEALDTLREAAAGIEADRAAEIEAARLQADRMDTDARKNYVFAVLPDGAAAPGDAFDAFGRHPVIRSVVDRYMGLRAAFRCCNVIRNFRVRNTPYASQLWHQDRDDHLMIKLFVYLSDVDPGRGPFTYGRGTHPLAPACPMPAHSLEGHVARSTDAQFEAVVPRTRWSAVSGSVGTMVFADTRGYHRGGRCEEGERLLYRAMYTSPGSLPFLRGASR